MFSGIIKEVGIVQSINSGVLSVTAPSVIKNAYIGQSIAVDGLCLTVKKLNYREIFFDFTPETYSASALKYLKIGTKVNIEPALTVSSDISGHFVLGHIDGIGKLVLKKAVKNSFVVGIKIFNTINDDFKKYLIKKGSITVNGVSLTINELKGDVFFMSIIPLTYSETNFRYKVIGDYVNLESDILEKTIVTRVDDILGNAGKNVKAGCRSDINKNVMQGKGLTVQFLSDNGYL